MKKQSFYYSPVTKNRVTSKLTGGLSPYMDDKSAYDKKSLCFNPEKEWLVKSSFAVSDINDVFSVVNGENFLGEIDCYLLPLGVYTSTDMVAKGVIPVNHKMVGSTDELIINKSQTTYSIGYYLPIYLFDTNVGTFRYAKTGWGAPQIDSEITVDVGQDSIDTNSIISELHEFTNDNLLELLNSNNTANRDKPYLFLTKCWDNSDGKPITLVSYTPIFLSFDDIPEASKFKVTIHQKTKANKDTLDIFHVVSSTKVWVINKHLKVLRQPIQSLFPGLCYDRSHSVETIKNDKPYFTGHGIISLISSKPQTSFVKMTSISLFSWLKDYTVLGNIIRKDNITKKMFKDYFTYCKSNGRWEMWSKQPSKYYDDAYPSMPLFRKMPDEFVKFYEPFFKYISFYTKDLSYLPIPAVRSVFGDSGGYPNSLEQMSKNVPMLSYMSETTFIQDSNNPTSILATTLADDLGVSLLNAETFSEIIPANSYIVIDNNSQYSSGAAVDYHTDVFINCIQDVQDDPLFETDIKSTIDQSIYVPFYRSIDAYNRYSFDRLYDVDDSPVTINYPMTDSHYTSVRSISDDVIFSDQLDDLTGLSKIPDDFLTSKLLDPAKEKLDAFNNAAQNQPNASQVVDKIMDGIKDKADNAFNNINPAQVTKFSIKQNDKLLNAKDLHNIKQQVTNEVKNQLKDDSNYKQVLTEDQYKQYQSFKQYIMGFTQEEPKTAVLGHLRILNTNILESPLYNGLSEEAGIATDKISLYSEMFLEEYKNILQTDPKALIDSIDMINEVNMINSIVSTQTKELENGFNEVKKFIDKVQDNSKEGIQNIHDKISSLFSSASTMSNSIIESANSYLDKANQMKNEFPNSYDTLLFNRNVTNVTGYLHDFVKSLISDPYLALKQHAAYLRSRLSKVSTKLMVIEGVIKAMDFIPTIPNLIIEGIGNVAGLIGNVALFALSTALDAVTIIDNVDKLVFISEQFLSKGIEKYATIPTVYDDMFSPPDIAPTRYDHFHRKAKITIKKDLSIATQIRNKLLETKTNPIIIEDQSYSYNDYSLDDLVGSLGGFYYPNTNELGLPLIKPVGNYTDILPDLSDFIPSYPQRGNLWKLFIKQISPDDQKEIAESLSPYIPLTEEILATYSAVIVGAGALAAAGAVVSAGLRGDWIGAAVGAVTAAAIVIGANVKELVTISLKRGLINNPNNVYTYFYNKKAELESFWSSRTTTDFISSNYTYVSVQDDIPLFSDASDFKKYFLKVKEILILTTQLVGIAAVGFMIGKIANKITTKINNKKKYKGLKAKNKRERAALAGQADQQKKDLDNKISQVQNDPNLSDKDKKEKVKELEKEKKNVDKWLKGEAALLPTNKQGLQGLLSSNWGVTPLASSSAAKTVSSLASLGPLTSKVMEPFNEEVKKFSETEVGKDVEGLDQEITNDESNSLSSALSNALGAGSSLFELLTSIQSDTKDIKKFT